MNDETDIICTQCASTLVEMGRLIRNWRKWTGSSRKTV